MRKRVVAKIMSLLVAASMLVTVAGCGSNDETNKPSSGEKSSEVVESSSKAEGATESSAEEVEVAEKTYDEHIEFDATFHYSLAQASAGHDLESDPLISWILDKFNVTVNQWECATNTAGEKTRLWVNGGTMPDAMTWTSITPSELMDYAEQGLLQPLPDGWEDRWPNLKKMFDATASADQVTIDGKVYGIPHAVNGNFLEVEVPVDNAVLYYRKDFAEQIGMADMGSDGSVSMKELKEYLTKVADAELCENPTLLVDKGNMVGLFKKFFCLNGNTFTPTEDGFIWSLQQEGMVDMIAEMQEWYNAGLIDPDYYVKTTATAEYREGISAASVFAGNTASYSSGVIDKAMEADGKDPTDETERAAYRDKFTMAAIEGIDGTVQCHTIRNYWLITSFSPDTDEATMERILDMMDWFCSYEGQASVTCGIPGEDFTVDEEGKITILNEDIMSGKYEVHPSGFFDVWGYCGDDMQYSMGIPGAYEEEIALSLKTYEAKWNGSIAPLTTAYERLQSEAKDNYSASTSSIIHEIVTQNKDVESNLTAYIEANRNLWQPVVDDLNAGK